MIRCPAHLWEQLNVERGAAPKFFFFLNNLFLNIFRIAPGLPNVTEYGEM